LRLGRLIRRHLGDRDGEVPCSIHVGLLKCGSIREEPGLHLAGKDRKRACTAETPRGKRALGGNGRGSGKAKSVRLTSPETGSESRLSRRMRFLHPVPGPSCRYSVSFAVGSHLRNHDRRRMRCSGNGEHEGDRGLGHAETKLAAWGAAGRTGGGHKPAAGSRNRPALPGEGPSLGMVPAQRQRVTPNPTLSCGKDASSRKK